MNLHTLVEPGEFDTHWWDSLLSPETIARRNAFTERNRAKQAGASAAHMAKSHETEKAAKERPGL